jgi:hypothetical protein
VVADVAGIRRGSATLALDGPEPAFILVLDAGRLLVATGEGVVAVQVHDEGGLQLIRDEKFDGSAVRAPLAGPLGRRSAR